MGDCQRCLLEIGLSELTRRAAEIEKWKRPMNLMHGGSDGSLTGVPFRFVAEMTRRAAEAEKLKGPMGLMNGGSSGRLTHVPFRKRC